MQPNRFFRRPGASAENGTRRAVVLVVFTLWSVSTGTSFAQEPGGPHLQLPQVLEQGTAGPTLILIPCAGCGAASWERFMDSNKDRFRMIAVTLPGYAGSPRPELPLWTGETVFQDNAIEQLVKLIDKRGLQDVVVVGQSFGSLIALRLATAKPDAIRAVINVDGSPTNPVGRASRSPAQRLAEARKTVDEDWAVRLQDPEAFRRFNGAHRQPDEEQRKFHHGMFMASDRVSMLHYWRENILRDRNSEFVGLRTPYLDVKAIFPWDKDPEGKLASYADSIAKIGTPKGYQRVVFRDTSHWVHLERPRALGSTILDFLAGRPLTDVGPFRFDQVIRVGNGLRDVILMPCLGCDATSWGEFMERNRERYRMVAVTWPGLGSTVLPPALDSSSGTPYFDYLMEALDWLIERDELDRPVLVGHSAAAVAALRYAAERPERLSGVVNVDAIVANGDTYGFTPDQRREWADAEMVDVLNRYDDDAAWAKLNSAPSGMSLERGKFYERMWQTPPRENVLAYWRDWLRTDAGILLPRLPVPFLAIHALPDDAERAAAKLEDLDTRYRRAPMPPGARVVYMEGSGHTIWEYRPEAFDRALADFVLGSTSDSIGRDELR